MEFRRLDAKRGVGKAMEQIKQQDMLVLFEDTFKDIETRKWVREEGELALVWGQQNIRNVKLEEMRLEMKLLKAPFLLLFYRN